MPCIIKSNAFILLHSSARRYLPVHVTTETCMESYRGLPFVFEFLLLGKTEQTYVTPIKQLHEEDVVEESLSDSMTTTSDANYCLHSRKLKSDPGKSGSLRSVLQISEPSLNFLLQLMCICFSSLNKKTALCMICLSCTDAFWGTTKWVEN